MSRQNRPGINEEIARMLTEGATRKAICKALKVGFARVTAVANGTANFAEINAAALRSLGLPADWSPDAKAVQPADRLEVEAGDVVFGEPDDDVPDTVTVSADYLRALEALLFVVEQNRALRASLEAA